VGRSRHTQDNIKVFVLLCKLVMQGMAASILAYPAVLLYLLANDRMLLSQHDEVWVFGCTAPLWALWACGHRVDAPPGMIPYCSPIRQPEGVIVSAGCRTRCRRTGSYLSGARRRPFFSVNRKAAEAGPYRDIS
jgi:hypothetical protein